MTNTLLSRLQAQITTSGPLSVLDYVTQALWDLDHGYYSQSIPIGRDGDYITAPEMTQVFGELIASWLVDTWQKAGAPPRVSLVEMGPGLGTMMADILRTFHKLSVMQDVSVHLIEMSEPLKIVQRQKLKPYEDRIHHHETLDHLPQNYTIFLGNEFWDALPVRQEVFVGGEWIDRCVDTCRDGLVFRPNEPYSIRETCPAMPNLVKLLAKHLHQFGGAALFIDYGYDQPDARGDTVQALSHHHHQSPLHNPGAADLTHHVDFQRLKALFEEAGLVTQDIVSQGEFLIDLGMYERTEALCTKATPEQRGSLRTAAIRLTHEAQMGRLFKVLRVIKSF